MGKINLDKLEKEVEFKDWRVRDLVQSLRDTRAALKGSCQFIREIGKITGHSITKNGSTFEQTLDDLESKFNFGEG